MAKIETHKSKHEQLKELLIEDIRKNRYPVGARLASEQELIRRYDVSNTTVHKALASLEHEGHIYREKGRGTFVADYKRSNGLKNKRVLGFITTFSGMDRAFLFGNIVRGIVDGIQEHGCEMLFRSSHEVVEQEVQHIKELSDIADGLVIFPSGMANTSDDVTAALLGLRERRIPFVLLDRYISRVNCNYVVTDNFAGTYGAVEHLAKLGYKSVVLLGHEEWKFVTSMRDRIRGYEQAVRDFHLAETPRDTEKSELFIPDGTHLNSAYDRAVEDIMEICGGRAAVVTTEYHPAVGVVEAAQRMGLRVPEDIAVVGFDEYQVPGHGPSVGITTVLQPMYDIGRTAIDLVMGNIKNGAGNPENIFLKPELVIKDSCGARLVGVLSSTQ